MSTTLPEPARKVARLALLGNPNTGKTSLFNDLTGMRQRVGNYPGITVEKKIGIVRREAFEAEILDLPGTYSLAAASLDERVVVDVLTGHVPGTQPPELVVFVADSCNLRRNLFLAAQIADLGIPMVIALNLMDVAKKRGLSIDVDLLSERLGVPVIPTIATRDVGIAELKEAIEKALEDRPRMAQITWPAAVNDAVADLRESVRSELDTDLTDTELRRMLFDADSAILERLHWFPSRARDAIGKGRSHLQKAGFNPLAAEALILYEQLGTIVDGVASQRGELTSRSESIDTLMIHRFWGLLIFVGMMFVVFQSVYAWAGPLMDWINGGKSWVQAIVSPWFTGMPILQSLMKDGVIEGVGAFVIFLPQILILFLFIALLEDTGYMSRAAFLMDKLFHWCGLNGKSFVPMLSSYACAVPGIMATRTIEDPKARLTTILLAPLMSCSARLPVYVLLIGAFVQPAYGAFWSGVVLFVMHFVGLAVAIPLAFLFTRFLVKTRVQPFLMEMPPYRVPRMRNVVFRMYEAGREFVERAGTVILAITIVVWALLYFPRPDRVEQEVTEAFVTRQAQAQGTSPEAVRAALEDGESEWAAKLEARIDSAYVNQSILGRMGRSVQPVFAPAGFDWKITVGVLASFPAREVIISTLGVIYSLGGDVDEESGDLRQALQNQTWQEGSLEGRKVYTLPVVFAIMVFFALCSQCGSTLAVIAKESNWKWALFVFCYMTGLAWIAAVVVYQVGNLFA